LKVFLTENIVLTKLTKKYFTSRYADKTLEEKTVNIDGNSIRFLEEGDSDHVLLLIHGLGASAERWENVIPLFSKKYRVIVPDLIGFGHSEKPSVDYTTDYFADFMYKFVSKMQIKNFSIIGSSLGGQIGAEFTSNHNDLVKKLVLVSPSGIMKHSTPALDTYIMAALYPNSESATMAFQTMSGQTQIDEELITGFVERMKMPNAKMAFMSTLLGLRDAEIITEKLGMITIPTLIVWGENDPVIPIKYSESFVSSINDCRFYKMVKCGHTPFVEDPKGFFDLVSDFLK
jgi:pimeloyl-ACP methyl ester carboxylesterase